SWPAFRATPRRFRLRRERCNACASGHIHRVMPPTRRSRSSRPRATTASSRRQNEVRVHVTAFDLMVIGVVGLSTVFAFWRGFVRVTASLAAWVIAVLAALRFSDQVGSLLPDLGETEATRYVLAFALILVGVLIVGALAGFLL